MTVGENIRKLRQEKGLTIKQLGELCNISEPNMGNYERGLRNPKLETIKKIAAALGVDASEILPLSPFAYKQTMYSETYKIDTFVEDIESLGYNVERRTEKNKCFYDIHLKNKYLEYITLDEDAVYNLLNDLNSYLEFQLEKIIKNSKIKKITVNEDDLNW